jgi:predicted deacylase
MGQETMSTKTIEKHALPAGAMGGSHTLTCIRYGGKNNNQKAYLQAGLHADEPPGYLVMHHLLDRLDRADGKGDVTGEIILVPVANPIGAGQWRDECLQGRFDFFNNINFNRQHLDLTAQVAERIEKQLHHNPVENVSLIRRETKNVLRSLAPRDQAETLKHRLLSLSHDADIVLDLHCDRRSLMHVYMGETLWPDAADLSAQMGAEVTLLADDSGVTPFDEACSRIWWNLAKRFPDYPIPTACLAATLELRGQGEVSHDLAARDAENLFRFLQRRGFIRGRAPQLPGLTHEATPLAGVEQIKAPMAGVVVFLKEPGQWVQKGEVVAEVINPLGSTTNERIHPLVSTTEGTLFSNNADCFARPGRILSKIAGKTPLKGKGENLLTN